MAEIFRASVNAQQPRFLKNRFYRVPRLFAPTTHFSPANDAIARGAVARLTQTLAAALAPYKTPEKRRVFISREDSGRGDDREPRFANAEALALALKSLDIEPVVASRLPVEDYLRTFVNSELIVGLHGAGLMNAVLSGAPEGAGDQRSRLSRLAFTGAVLRDRRRRAVATRRHAAASERRRDL